MSGSKARLERLEAEDGQYMGREEAMSEIKLPLPVRLLLEVAALRLQVKALQAEVTELKARLAILEPSDAV